MCGFEIYVCMCGFLTCVCVCVGVGNVWVGLVAGMFKLWVCVCVGF